MVKMPQMLQKKEKIYLTNVIKGREVWSKREACSLNVGETEN